MPSPLINNVVDSFAQRVRRFEMWVNETPTEGAAIAREALIHLTSIYVAALTLPPAVFPENERKYPVGVGNDEWQRVRRWCARFPFQYYCDLVEPTDTTASEAGLGDLADDIADIYRDVVAGLRLFEAGLGAEALFEWGLGFRTHWGRHATAAIHALHCWLAANAPDSFAEA